MAKRTNVDALDEFVDELSVHNVSRGEFDSFDGETTHFPAGEERDREWWSKRVEIYRGDVDLNRNPPVEGRVSLLLYTEEPPVELFDDSHDGATDLTMAGEHDWRL